MGLGDFLKKQGRKLTDGVRGLGRLARGVVTLDGDTLMKGLKDVGGAAQVASWAIPGLGPVAAAGVGGLGGLVHGGIGSNGRGFNVGQALASGAGGALAGYGGGTLKNLAMSKLGGGGSPGYGDAGAYGVGPDGPLQDAVQMESRSGAGGIWDLIKDKGGDALGALGGLKGLGGLALGGLALKDANNARNDAAAFESGKFDLLKAALAKSEAAYDERAPLRAAGMSSLMDAMTAMKAAGPGAAAQHMIDLQSGKRRAGEYV